MTEHPETANKPIISPAVEDVLADQFSDELKHGTNTPRGGTNAGYAAYSDTWLAETKRNLTFTNLLVTQAFEVASKTDRDELYRTLASLGGTVVQWMEAINRERGV